MSRPKLSSVWMCKRNIIFFENPLNIQHESCELCGCDKNSCDAVEYAPKRDLDAAINERDLLQERCDELRKKIALMEEKG